MGKEIVDKNNGSEVITKNFGLQINGYQIEKYFPDDFTPELMTKLAVELSPLTCEGFMRSCVSLELIKDVSNHLMVSDRIVVARDTEQKPIAFMTSSMHTFEGIRGEQELMYHLEGIIVKPECQGSGLSKQLIAQDVLESGATYLGFHTQNGRMKSLGLKIAYINDDDSLRYANIIDTHKLQGVHDVGRYGNTSLYGNQEKFALYALTDINWRQGDAAVCIGPIRSEILR